MGSDDEALVVPLTERVQVHHTLTHEHGTGTIASQPRSEVGGPVPGCRSHTHDATGEAAIHERGHTVEDDGADLGVSEGRLEGSFEVRELLELVDDLVTLTSEVDELDA